MLLRMPDPWSVAVMGLRSLFAGAAWGLTRPQKRRAHRLAIKRDVDANLRVPRDEATDVIVRNEWKMDSYPEIDRSRGRAPSPWHKSEVIGSDDRGLLICAGWTNVRVEDGLAFDHPDGGQMMIVWRIPYSNIGEIDWRGDGYYPMPHVYCRYRLRRGPYDKKILAYFQTEWGSWIEEHFIEYRPHWSWWSRRLARRRSRKRAAAWGRGM